MATKTKTETKTEAAAADVMANTTATVAETTKAVSGLFSALSLSGRKAVEGVIAFDKALFGYSKDALKSYADHGRAVVKAKSVNDLIDLQVAYAHGMIEQNAANAREILDLATLKAKEAYAPVQEAVAPYMPGKKTAA